MKRNPNWATTGPWLLLTLACAVLVLLGLKHRRLREDFIDHRRADGRLQAGMYVPAFHGTSVTNDSIAVGAPPFSGRQVVVLLTAACPFCRQSLPSWNALASALAAVPQGTVATRLVGLTTDSLPVAESYAMQHKLGFPLVPFPSRKHVALYRAFTVPQTIVLDWDGRVLHSRHGVVESKAAIDSVIAAVNRPPIRLRDSASLRPSSITTAITPRVASRGKV